MSTRSIRNRVLYLVPFLVVFMLLLVTINSQLSVSNIMHQTKNTPANQEQLSYNTSFVQIEVLLSYLDYNSNYSSISVEIASFVNTSSVTVLISSGVVVLNNTSYSLDFRMTAANNTNSSYLDQNLTLINNTLATQRTRLMSYSWNNTTVISISSASCDELQNYSTSVFSYLSMVNRSKEVQYTYYATGNGPFTDYPLPKETTSYVNSSDVYSIDETMIETGNSTTKDVNITSPNFSVNGTGTTSQSGNDTNLLSGNMSGFFSNSTNVTSFIGTISDNNVTMQINSDPTNISVDPQSHFRSVDGGTELMEVVEASFSQGYITASGAWAIVYGIMSVFIGIVAWTAPEGLVATGVLLASFVGLLGTYLGMVAYFGPEYIASDGSAHAYVELGYFFKLGWFYFEFLPLAQLGFYSNQITNNNVYPPQVTSCPWTYFPMLTVAVTDSWTDQWYVTTPHTSVWPNGFP